MRNSKKGFTLIELLVVIGILVVLATVVVLVLNPAEIFRQARDSKRISDLETLRSAVTYYVSTVSSPTLFDGAACQNQTGTYFFSVPTAGANAIDGTGWITGLNFAEDANSDPVPGGSPISTLPIDPINLDDGLDDGTGDFIIAAGDHFYAFICSDSSGNFKIAANMESVRYSAGGPDDIETDDGGTDLAGSAAGGGDTVYETGSCVGDDYDDAALGTLCDPL